MSRHQDPRMFLSDLWEEEMINTCHKSFPNWEALNYYCQSPVKIPSAPPPPAPRKKKRSYIHQNLTLRMMWGEGKALKRAAMEVLEKGPWVFLESK